MMKSTILGVVMSILGIGVVACSDAEPTTESVRSEAVAEGSASDDSPMAFSFDGKAPESCAAAKTSLAAILEACYMTAPAHLPKRRDVIEYCLKQAEAQTAVGYVFKLCKSDSCQIVVNGQGDEPRTVSVLCGGDGDPTIRGIPEAIIKRPVALPVVRVQPVIGVDDPNDDPKR